ncbi:ead/Ea22-like family protein [Klebsiella pneumoniae]|uniref:ead/Ea22-like family protein n=1 Tax=Klebsiella pneumoniae TaxID=573 RepID=UPI0028704910|nr:ead/Ea22-like family protein [Klebsiella pneumoniae]
MTDITELAQSLKAEDVSPERMEWLKKLADMEYCASNPGHWLMSLKETNYLAVVALQCLEKNLALVEALEKAQQRNAELEAQNEYIRKRYQQLDLLIGKNILVMQAAIIEWQATGDAKNGLAWIYNTLFGPGELPDEAEKDAQAYFDRKYAPLDEELMALHKWFWEQSEAERAAAGIKVEAE